MPLGTVVPCHSEDAHALFEDIEGRLLRAALTHLGLKLIHTEGTDGCEWQVSSA
jgi:hypothetical protein